ncbi:MAG TPA: ABC transporter ATP-binding protein [Acidobacteriota bacterium]|nr:ABC transporter ATP-binding protein [Acidobacteriota bacterium]
MSREQAAAPAIALQGITKRYGRLVAVRNLDLEVASGEIFGFLGLNGAGKTTTIRILLDLLRPSAGKAYIFGRDCQRHGLDVRGRVGYLPGELGLYGEMTGGELLELLARLGQYNVKQEYRTALLEKLQMSKADLERRLREYSTGMKRKLGLIQALQGDPQLLILDEPTEGLDPLMQESFYEVLFEVRSRGRTVFMSSHVLSEVERVCSRIGLLRKGELVLLSHVGEIRRVAARRVRVHFSEDVPSAPSGLPEGHELLEIQPRTWSLRLHGALGPLVKTLSGLPVEDVEVYEPRLEEVLMKYYREEDR